MANDYGIKIALPGFDVTKATPEQCAVHSGYDTMKIKNTASPEHFGVINLTATSTPSTTVNVFTMSHGYSYRPASIIHWSDSSRAIAPYSVTGFYPLNATFDQFFVAYCTDTQFKIDYVNNALSGAATITGNTYKIRYYIFANDGN